MCHCHCDTARCWLLHLQSGGWFGLVFWTCRARGVVNVSYPRVLKKQSATSKSQLVWVAPQSSSHQCVEPASPWCLPRTAHGSAKSSGGGALIRDRVSAAGPTLGSRPRLILASLSGERAAAGVDCGRYHRTRSDQKKAIGQTGIRGLHSLSFLQSDLILKRLKKAEDERGESTDYTFKRLSWFCSVG